RPKFRWTPIRNAWPPWPGPPRIRPPAKLASFAGPAAPPRRARGAPPGTGAREAYDAAARKRTARRGGEYKEEIPSRGERSLGERDENFVVGEGHPAAVVQHRGGSGHAAEAAAAPGNEAAGGAR